MSGISSWVAGDQEKQASEEASHSNRVNTLRTNRLNRAMYDESRGLKGNAVLPLYLKTAEGGSFEDEMIGRDLMAAWNSTGRTMAEYEVAARRLRPLQDQATAAGGGIFNGAARDKALANFEPVKTGRVAFSRQAAIESANKELAKIEANQARNGTRDSMGARLMKLNAGRAAAVFAGSAGIQNLEEERAIRDRYDIELPLQSLDLPYAMAQRELATLQLPQDAYLDSIGRRLQPFNFMRIGAAAPFEYKPMPMVSSSPSGAQLAAQGMAAASGTALNYYLKQRQAAQVADAGKAAGFAQSGGYGAGIPQNYGAWNTATQADYADAFQSGQDWIAANPDVYAALE